jgi:hypothetical protein
MDGKRRWHLWTAAALALPVLYIASFGPVCWLIQDSKSGMAFDVTADVYRPLIRVANLAPAPIRDAAAGFSGKGRYGIPTMLDCLTAILDGKLRWL